MAENEVDDDEGVVVTNADNCGNKKTRQCVRPTFPVLQVS